ncbi:MAG: Rne/Rng family ribonuclease [Alphaproteobacteria bacterium]|nr:Rne/Rng family ribonuclease [Alphaproteobacteria bacterium]
MAKRMLIDATHPEETRVVVLSGNRLEDFDFETSTKKQLKGNIYLAKVTRVEPSLQAAFVDYGGNRHGFLAFSEIHPDYYQIPVADRERLLAEMAKIERGESTGNGQEGGRRDRDDRRGRRGRHDRRRDRSRQGGEKPPVDAEAAAQPVEGAATESAPQSDEAPTTEAVAAIESSQPSATETPSDNAVETADRDTPTEPGAAIAEASGTAPDVLYDTEPAEDSEEAPAAPANGEALSEPDHAAVETAGESQVEMIGGDDNEELARRRQRLLRNYKIQEVIKRRQILLVQVVKEERGTKGAALTTYLSLAGRYCVLMPNTARGGGVSRKITNASDRKRLKSMIDELDLPEGMGLIVRTAGSERTKTEVKRDCDYLIRLWDSIRETTLTSTAPCLIHAEADLIKRSIRDLYSRDIEEVLVDGEEQYKAAKDFMKMLMPSHAKRVQRYKADDGLPLFQKSQVESQLDAMHSPMVPLKSGGSIVINQTEALVAIDVNSGRATRERHIEDTALKTNLEAADEVARQLRLRDLAGLIVIDFIDMEDGRHNHQVERRLKDAMRHDRARIQIGRISAFGLLELSRQRLRPSLVEASTTLCPHCGGTGHIRSTESTSLHVLRAIEEEGAKRRAAEVMVYVPAGVALYILNHKRMALADIETRHGMKIFLGQDDQLVPPNHRIERLKIRDAQSQQPPQPEPRPQLAQAPALPPPADEEDDEGEAPERAPQSAEAQPQQQPRGENGEERGGRRRRRRRRRRGGDRPHQQGEGMPPAAEPNAEPTLFAPDGGGEDEAAELPERAEGTEPRGPAPMDGEEGEGGRRRRRGRRGGRRRGRREEGEGHTAEGVTPPADESMPPSAPPVAPPPPAPAFQPPAYQPAYQPTSVADQVLSAFEQLETQEASPRSASAAERAPSAAEPVNPVDPNPPVQVIGGDATVTPKRGGWWRRR